MSNHITTEYDENTLTAAQLEGRACVVCGTESGPMQAVSLYIHEGGETDWVACSGDEPEPVKHPREISPTIEARAHDAGVKAIEEFKAEWLAEMQAHENEAQAKASGTAGPVAWLVEDPCDSWCSGSLDHNTSTDPGDRIHFGESTFIPLVTMEPVVMAYPEAWAPPELMISLERRYREWEARVYVAVGDKPGLSATLAEAEQIAFTILDMVRRARGQESPKILPYDSHGQCVTRDCATCRIDQASA